MSMAVNCNLSDPQYYLSKVSAGLGTCTAFIVCFFYAWDIGCLATRGFRRRCTASDDSRRCDLPVNPLSGLLASVIAIILIIATGNSVALPQPLESTSLLVMMLAQASVLGWQDHDPDSKLRALVEKLADVAAVVLSAFTLSAARDQYIAATSNGFYTVHDPKDQVIIAYVLSAVGCVVGLAQMLVLAFSGTRRRKRKYVLRTISIVFFSTQIVTAVVSIWYGAHTISEGCAIFNTTKIVTMCVLGLGVLYSLAMSIGRFLSLPLADDDVESGNKENTNGDTGDGDEVNNVGDDGMTEVSNRDGAAEGHQ